MLNLEFYLNQPYTEIVLESEDGGYFGFINELEGCRAEAETEERCRTALKDAKEYWLRTAFYQGDEIPLPSNV